MDILYFAIHVPSLFGPLHSQKLQCLYIPDPEIILAKMHNGLLPGYIEWGVIDKNPEALDAARAIFKGGRPSTAGFSITDIQAFDYSGKGIQDLVDKARLLSKLNLEVQEGIESLLAARK